MNRCGAMALCIALKNSCCHERGALSVHGVRGGCGRPVVSSAMQRCCNALDICASHAMIGCRYEVGVCALRASCISRATRGLSSEIDATASRGPLCRGRSRRLSRV